MSEVYSKAVIGFSGLVDVILALETELKATKALVSELDARIQELADKADEHSTDLDDLIDERIESALSGREVEFDLRGTVTL